MKSVSLASDVIDELLEELEALEEEVPSELELESESESVSDMNSSSCRLRPDVSSDGLSVMSIILHALHSF